MINNFSCLLTPFDEDLWLDCQIELHHQWLNEQCLEDLDLNYEDDLFNV